MKIDRIEYLSDQQRKQFTERLLTLHQVLAESSDDNYWQPSIMVRGDYVRLIRPRNTCGTVACALGHARWHRERFPGLHVHIDADEDEAYFGPKVWAYIFGANSYSLEHGVEPHEVTRQMAMQRIVDYIEGALGCTLIPEEDDNEHPTPPT